MTSSPISGQSTAARIALLHKMELVNRELAAAISYIEHGLKAVTDEGVGVDLRGRR